MPLYNLDSGEWGIEPDLKAGSNGKEAVVNEILAAATVVLLVGCALSAACWLSAHTGDVALVVVAES